MMEITGTTTLTADVHRKAVRFNIFKTKSSVAWFIVCIVVIIICSVFLFFMGDIVLAIVFTSLALVMSAIVIFVPIIAVSMQKNMVGVQNHYKFTNEGLYVSSTGAGVNSNTAVRYELIVKIHEAEDCFYIYLTKAQIWPLLKKDITDSRVDELRNLLRYKMGYRFFSKFTSLPSQYSPPHSVPQI